MCNFFICENKTLTHQKFNVDCTIKCAGCGKGFVGKANRFIITGLDEHSNYQKNWRMCNS